MDKDQTSFVQLINFPNGGGASSYDLGFIVTQVIDKVGKDGFYKMAEKLPQKEMGDLEELIRAGLEYGDKDGDGKKDNNRIENKFPRISKLLEIKRASIE